MTEKEIKKLENNLKFKRKLYNKDLWKNYAFVPPTIVIFAGIVGIVYLLNIDKLISWNSLPFIIILIIGTIWLKATKRFLLNKKVNNSNELLICRSIVFEARNGRLILLFSIGKNRNNIHYLETEKKRLLAEMNYNLNNVSDRPKQINDSDLNIVRLPLSKKYSGKNTVDYWIGYSSDNKIYFIKETDLRKFS